MLADGLRTLAGQRSLLRQNQARKIDPSRPLAIGLPQTTLVAPFLENTSRLCNVFTVVAPATNANDSTSKSLHLELESRLVASIH